MVSADRLQRLEALDVSALSVAQISSALHDLAVIRGRADQLEASFARRLAELSARGESPPAADVLGRQGRTSRRTAERAERRADTLGQTPRLNDALGAGKGGSEHADALAGAAGRLSDEHRAELFGRDAEITQIAASTTPDTFRRKLNTIIDDITADDGLDRAARHDAQATLSIKVDDDTGMHVLHARLNPEQGNRLRRALDHEAAALAKLPEHQGLRRDQLLVRALDRHISGESIASGLGPAEIAVLIDYDTLVGGRHAGTVCEYSDGSPIPADAARRHACDSKIIPVVLGGKGEVLDVGRARRLATRSQRTALSAMYRTCAIDGCTTHFDNTHIHHLHEWEQLGPTDLGNLVPLCSLHHHRVHEGRWRLQLDPGTRQLTVHLPNGALHSTSHPDRRPDRLPDRRPDRRPERRSDRSAAEPAAA